MLTLSVATLHDISIHTSAREVTVFTERSVTDEIDFNPHFRKGSDIYRSELCYRKSHFNPHFRKGSDFPPHPFTPFCYYFNPHFRKGSDEPLLLSDPLLTISIHTSAREVTAVSVYMAGFSPISIHTSAREVTSLEDLTAYAQKDFNPHFRKGSDCVKDVLWQLVKISIHTSAREVTYGLRDHSEEAHIFQSTLPQGK